MLQEKPCTWRLPCFLCQSRIHEVLSRIPQPKTIATDESLMDWLLYLRLIGYTIGTLVELFWMVVILGYRRQRNFERVFFFLCLAFFLFYGGSLLALNSEIHYPQPPAGVESFAIVIISAGLCMSPALLLHLHMEYADTRGLLQVKEWKRGVLALFYLA